jgi:hypothetical protein
VGAEVWGGPGHGGGSHTAVLTDVVLLGHVVPHGVALASGYAPTASCQRCQHYGTHVSVRPTRVSTDNLHDVKRNRGATSTLMDTQTPVPVNVHGYVAMGCGALRNVSLHYFAVYATSLLVATMSLCWSSAVWLLGMFHWYDDTTCDEFTDSTSGRQQQHILS